MNSMLQWSKENKQKLVLFYMDQNNRVTQRFIRVIEIYEDSFIAFCFYRKQVRRFKFSYILSCARVKRRGSA
ncbi:MULTISPECIES: hypothetical protein [Virgibacillus]|uniref:WYL domain-containing protein n=1 Tax=Virgibacillus dokdonensis TaxID=302167 RepID=A0A2K9ITY0_9BACI|nr:MULTISPECIES: hypothetical protein [Virgibacillus]AUJ23232.1 hypothetical protein A21D_00117 [Virgibacillus dokdonensis]NWO14784.1 hypothetical protein [Virgibacillus sp.]